MKRFSLAITILLITTTTHAQFGDMLNRMKKEIDRGTVEVDTAKSQPSQNSASQPTSSNSSSSIPNLSEDMGKEKKQVEQKASDMVGRYNKATIYHCVYQDEVVKRTFNWYLAFENPCGSKSREGSCVVRWLQPLTAKNYLDPDDWITAANMPGGKTRPDIYNVNFTGGKYTWEEPGNHNRDILQLDSTQNVVYYRKNTGGDNFKTTQHSCKKIK
jgi:hypothetical protein